MALQYSNLPKQPTFVTQFLKSLPKQARWRKSAKLEIFSDGIIRKRVWQHLIISCICVFVFVYLCLCICVCVFVFVYLCFCVCVFECQQNWRFSPMEISGKEFDSRVNLHGVLLWGKVIGWQTSYLSHAPHAVQVSTFSSWCKNDKYEVCGLAAVYYVQGALKKMSHLFQRVPILLFRCFGIRIPRPFHHNTGYNSHSESLVPQKY